MNFAPPERRMMSFVLAKPQDGVSDPELWPPHPDRPA